MRPVIQAVPPEISRLPHFNSKYEQKGLKMFSTFFSMGKHNIQCSGLHKGAHGSVEYDEEREKLQVSDWRKEAVPHCSAMLQQQKA